MPELKNFDKNIILNPGFLLVFSAVFLSNVTDQYLQKQIEQVISSKDGLTNMIFVWGGLSIVSAILFPLIISIFCAYFLVKHSHSLKSFIEKFAELSFLETLRAYGKTFLWCFLLIIPGFIKYIQFLFTTFVVLFSPKYQNGEVDALVESKNIAKKNWKLLNLWLTLFLLILPLFMFITFDEVRTFSEHPALATMVFLIETCIQIAFNYILLKLFFKFYNQNEVTNGSYV